MIPPGHIQNNRINTKDIFINQPLFYRMFSFIMGLINHLSYKVAGRNQILYHNEEVKEMIYILSTPQQNINL